MRFWMFYFLMMFSFHLFGQCTQGNCHNGHGTFIFDDGTKYIGGFSDGVVHGRGIMYFTNGDKYLGDWQNGYRHGKGKLIFKRGDIYIGGFSKNEFSGHGKLKYKEGDIYEGEWKENLPHGQGSLHYTDGRLENGVFDHGQFTGVTTRIGPDSIINHDELNYHEYVAVSEGDPPAQHRLKDCSSHYCHNEMGMYKYLDGSIFEGSFVNGMPEGSGICHYANGDKYKGGWKNHSPHGEGVMKFASGQVYGAVWDYGSPKRQLLAKETLHLKEGIIEEKDEDRRIWAVIIGVSRYIHMPVLKYSDDDAYRIYAFLRSPEGGAVPDDQIRVIIDEDATREGILSGLQNTLLRADDNDVVFVYFSGHGLDGSFIPIDYDGYNNRIKHEEVIEIVSKSKAGHKMCFADACHSGSLNNYKGVNVKDVISQYYGAFNNKEKGTAFMLSSKAEEFSLEDNGLRQGVFSHFLIRGMQGEADQNTDRVITINELFNFVQFKVRKYTGNIQNPVLMGDFDEAMPVSVVR